MFCYNTLHMLTIDSNYSLKRRGILTLESNFLFNVYLPLIGYKACFIYLFLVNEYLFNKKEAKLRYLLDKAGITTIDFINNKKSLESLGLIQTLEKDNNYVFVLKSVLNPNDFFDNPVLKGLYVNKVGVEEANKIMKLYEIDDVDFGEYTDVSAGVKESFKIDFNEKDVNLNSGKSFVTINKNVVKDKFSEGNLIEYIVKKSNININDITPNDIQAMHELGALYGLNEKVIGQIMIDGYRDSNPKGKKIDVPYCKSRCAIEVSKYKGTSVDKKEKIELSGNTMVSQKINYYESTSPREFLKDKQNGVEPIKSDLFVIQDLVDKFNFSNGILNILVEYSLNNCDQKLVKNYIEKIAVTIARKGFNSSIEVYDYLFSGRKSNQTKRSVKVEKEEEIPDNLDEELEKLI